MNPGYFEKIVVHGLKLFSYIFKRLDKVYLERDLDHIVKDSAKLLRKYLPVSSYGIKIVWAESETLERYLDRGFVVIRMKYHKNRARNIARALIAYMPYILPSEARAIIEPDLALALSCVVAIRITKHDPEVVHQIYETANVSFQDSSKGKALLGKLEEIDEQSLFTRILLPEVIKSCLKAYPKTPKELKDEISVLVDILHALVKGELIGRPPILGGKYVNLSVVRVAKPEKILLDPNLQAHLNFAKFCRTRTLYVLAAGVKSKWASKLTQSISKELKCKIDFEDVYRATYRGSPTNIYCAKLSSSS